MVDELDNTSKTIELVPAGDGAVVTKDKIRLSHQSEDFHVSLLTGTDRNFIISVKPSQSLPVGSYFDSIKVWAIDREESLMIPIYAKVDSRVFAIPSAIAVLHDPISKKFAPVEIRLVCRASNNIPGVVEIRGDNCGMTIEDLGQQGDLGRRVRLTRVDHSTTKIKSPLRLRLGFKGSTDECEVKLIFNVEPAASS
jgi:hypothetical protein